VENAVLTTAGQTLVRNNVGKWLLE